MFALTEFSRTTQRTLCMLVAVAIVVASFAFAEYKTQAALHSGYSVTITQLQ